MRLLTETPTHHDGASPHSRRATIRVADDLGHVQFYSGRAECRALALPSTVLRYETCDGSCVSDPWLPHRVNRATLMKPSLLIEGFTCCL
jgi:hypothetical protein